MNWERGGAGTSPRVFSSDLGRAVETASIAFGNTCIPVLYDWRLRECDYGRRNAPFQVSPVQFAREQP